MLFPCCSYYFTHYIFSQVCTFGSVPLKTYLPDGDIDLTAFSHDLNLKDTWASRVRDMLENEEKNENAEFHVKEVQYIQAEVFLPHPKFFTSNVLIVLSIHLEDLEHITMYFALHVSLNEW